MPVSLAWQSNTGRSADAPALYDPQGHELLTLRTENGFSNSVTFICEDAWKNPYLQITLVDTRRE